MCRSTEGREEDLTGGFVPHAQARPDALEEGEVPSRGFIAHGNNNNSLIAEKAVFMGTVFMLHSSAFDHCGLLQE